MSNTIDSNIVGLSYAEEETIKTLPTTPTWYLLEPNSYTDFGAEVKVTPRMPINSSRQRQKGVVTDLDASGGFQQDLTFDGLTRLLQGVFFADIREHPTTAPMNSTAVTITGVTASSDTYAAAAGLDVFAADDIVYASGFTSAANNGLQVVVSAGATALVVGDGLADETPPAAAKIVTVGHQFASGTLEVDTTTGTWPRLNRASGSKDFTDFGLTPGEWIYVGGDSAATLFATAACNGWMRVRSVAAAYIEIDKSAGTLVADAGTSKTIQVFMGDVLKNETSPVRRTYQIERSLGEDDNGTMSEYLIGAVPSEFTLNVKQGEILTCDVSFIGCDVEHRDGTTEVKSGTRPALVTTDAFNATSDVSRIEMSLVTEGTSNASSLFAFLTDLTIKVNNSISAEKAVATLGAFGVTAGDFVVNGDVSVYFADTTSVAAIRANSDVTIDAILVKENKGVTIDMPLITLGDGRLKVEKDKAVTLPLNMEAAESDLGHTLAMGFFSYLPTVAG